MLNIILCDKNPDVLDLMKGFIENYCLMEELNDIKVELATVDPLEVLDLFRTNVKHADGTIEQVAKELKHRLLCFDLDLGDLGRERNLNGMTLANEIRRFDIGADISFLTHHITELSEVVNRNIAPVSFLPKPFIMENKEALRSEILGLVKTAHERMSRNRVDKRMIGFSTGIKNQKVYVNLAEIYYVKVKDKEDEEKDKEAKLAQTVLYEAGGKQYFKQTLSFYNRQISELFKMGRSYLINPLHIKKSQASGRRATVVMSNGDVLHVTRKSLTSYEENYEKWVNTRKTNGVYK